MSGSLADLFIRVGADSSGVRSGLAEGDRALTETEQRWQKAGAGMRDAGQTLTRSVTLPMIAAGAIAVKTAVDFDTSMSRIQGLAGASASEVDAMRSSVLALSEETTIGPQRLADAMYFIASSGITGAAAMEALEASAKASAAGLGEVEVVADAVTSSMNAYSESGLTAAQATDVLVGMVKEGKGEASEMAGQLGRILPFAAQLGVSFNDLGAGLAYLTRSSGDSRLATTQLGGALQHMLVPSQQGRQVLEEVGLSVDGLRAMIQEKGLLGALTELNDRFGGSEQKWKMLVEEGQAVAGILSLVKNEGRDAAPVFEALGDSAGNLDNAFGAFAESAGFEAKQAFAEIQVELVKLGDSLIPAVSGVAKFGASVASVFGSLPQPVQTAMLVFAGFAAALGPMLTVGGNLIKVWGMMPSAVTAGVQSLIAATQAAYAANPALFAVSAAVMAAVAAWSFFKGSQDPEPVQELTAAIQEQGSALGDLSQAWLNNRLVQEGDTGTEIVEGLVRAGAGVGDLEAALAAGGDELERFMDLMGLARATNEFDPLGDLIGDNVEEERDKLRGISEEYRASVGAAEVYSEASIDAAGATGEMGDAAAAAEQQMQDMTSAIEELFAAALGTEGARIQFQMGLLDMQQAIAEGTFTLDESTRAGLQNRQALIGMAGDAKAHAAAVYEETGSIDQANFVLGSHIAQLAGVMQQAGMTEEAAAQYIATLLGIPPEQATEIHSNADLVRIVMANLRDTVNEIPRNVTIAVNAVTSGIDAAANAIDALRQNAGQGITVTTHTDKESGAKPATRPSATGPADRAGALKSAVAGTLTAPTIPGTASPGSGIADTTTINNFYRVSLTEALARVPAGVRDRARSFLEGRD